jgi:hypothetical protein
MKRRDFLRASAVAGAVLGTGFPNRSARALPFGAVPRDQTSSVLPQSLQAESVLECFLYGGLTPWESYYCVPERGQADETWAHTNYQHLLAAAEGCGFGNAASDPFRYFAKDSAGQEIFFGPYMGRLLARPDVLGRLRVVVNRHSFSPHEAAVPFVATGRVHGHPAGAGLATHVNRYFVDRDVDVSHAAPFAYHLSAGAGFTVGEPVGFDALGLHPAQARPLRIKLEAAARLDALLKRGTVGTSGERAQYDALLGLYFDQYGKRFQLGGGEVLRAEHFQEQRRAFARQSNSEVIRSLLPASDFAPWNTPKLCEEVSSSPDGQVVFNEGSQQVTANPSTGNLPAMGLRLATHLLTHPVHPARHCTVVDSGVRQADGGGGYDTHSNGPWRQATNFNNLLEHLLGFINRPGEGDPNKLDLDKTMVILSSEFGRAPGRQRPGTQGRDHWPAGFAQIYIGGPIRQAQAGVYGHIEESGTATQFTTPAENRIAALLALGIYPFGADAYAPSDVPGQTEAGSAARSIIERVLGHEL